MVNDKFWQIVKEYNKLMKSAIEGPNCISICHGDCCSIKINVPKILAEEYIKQGYANKNDFTRGDVFSFKLRFDDMKGKCFLYDKKINGCLVHNSGIKPPQCWIYPTNFSNPILKDISCKRANGWKIINTKKARKAEELLQYYVFLCKLEAKKEVRAINTRLNNNFCENNLRSLLKCTPPSQLSGFKDTWDCISILPAQGLTLQVKKFCEEKDNKCEFILNKNFLECQSICEEISKRLLDFLKKNLLNYVKRNPDSEGEYPFFKLLEFNTILD
ncbi:MAG: YkgJ family cysteine cluster protein [Candidatus Hodarchaeota archaeon]